MAKTKRLQGPNVKKLAIRFMSRSAIQDGGGLEDAIKFLSDPSAITSEARKGISEAFAAIDAVKRADDNPWGDSDEDIAAAILKEIEKVNKQRFSRHNPGAGQ